jgi:hydroxymethylbilane synthase
MAELIKIGTRESSLAMWQATQVKDMLADLGYASTLVPVTSDGDIDQSTPLYEMGVQGIFTKALDTSLLNNRIDIAVHSMKDVPTQLPAGVMQAAVLKRGSYKDLFVFNESRIKEFDGTDPFHQSLLSEDVLPDPVLGPGYIIGTSSVRRKAQWLHRYPGHKLVSLRGNINTRLQTVAGSNWDGAIFAAAGLERIGVRPSSSVDLEWMLPAPAQGAIMVVCRSGDTKLTGQLAKLNDESTARCTMIEKDFLRVLMGGCSTPVGALAIAEKKGIYFKGNILSLDGRQKIEIEKYSSIKESGDLGLRMANELLKSGGQQIAEAIRNGQ